MDAEALVLLAPAPAPVRPHGANPPGDDLNNADAELADAVRRVHARHPLYLRDVYRPRSDQQLFYDCMNTRKRTGNCPPGPCQRSGCASANKPGQSRHEAVDGQGRPAAQAVDMNPQDSNWGAFGRVCREEGLHDPIAAEDWHWQLNRHRSSVLGQP